MLSLMLAEGLGVIPAAIEPALAASELLHTASLLFDDLPAQDNATMRRGKPVAHRVFDEGNVQLAALSMIFHGFGLLGELDRCFPAARVTEITAYLGTVLGQRLCRGQSIDLGLSSDGAPATVDDIVDMYGLKTGAALAAALVPIMILVDRPAAEIDTMRQFAYHAGVVFQISDDILDTTSTTAILGKDVDRDIGKTNLVRTYGLATARTVRNDHLAKALRCCGQLPFDTNLLVCAVRHFASRRR